MNLKFDPDYTVHPSESLRECLEQRAVSDVVPQELIDKILEGETYTYSEALVLGEGTPYKAQMWIDMQTTYLSAVIQEHVDGKHL
jgi:hypothetical protein